MKNIAFCGIRLGILGMAGLLCTGCPNPNTYGTPRTTPVGKISHSVAAEAFGFSATDGPTGTSASATVPTLPTYTLRVGLADTVDIGARVSNLSSIGADVKWNFLKSEVFDMAIDPGFQFFYVAGTEASFSTLNLHGPLMFGINAGDSVSIVPTVGVSYAYATASGDFDSGNGRSSAVSTSGLMFRGGLGFDFRVTERFAIHPEFTLLKSLNADREDSVILYMAGIGFNFGNLPKYGAGAEAKAKAE